MLPLVFLPLIILPFASGQIVNTSYGQIQGYTLQDAAVFLGIPFASPPIGNLRFKPPSPPEKLQSIFNASTFSPPCLQDGANYLPVGITPNEDCLYLNVFTPSVGGKYPVMLWLHGGGYTQNSGIDFPPDGIVSNLVNHSVVVVTINYRLNLFGFFTTQTSDFPGNIGLLDQIAALKWVQQEIKNFGGDPDIVTLFGQSAGASSASLLNYSPKAKGLFHRAILESGSAYTPWSLNGRRRPDASLNASKYVASKFNCTTEADWNQKNFTGMLECLQSLQANDLLAVELEIDADYLQEAWNPVIDGDVLLDWPENTPEQQAKIPMMMGSNRDEHAQNSVVDYLLGQVISMDNFTQATFDYWRDALADPQVYADNAKVVSALVDAFYGDKQQPNLATSHTTWFERYVELHSDYSVNQGVLEEAQLLSQKEGASSFLYSLDFFSQNAPWNAFYPAIPHGAEAVYVFGGKPIGGEYLGIELIPTEDDKFMIEFFGVVWTNFAKTGNPNPVPTSGNSNCIVLWEPLSRDANAQYLSIKPTPEMKSHFHMKGFEVFENLLPTMLHQQQTTEKLNTITSVSSTSASKTTTATKSTTSCGAGLSLILIMTFCSYLFYRGT